MEIIYLCHKRGKEACTKGGHGFHKCMLVENHPRHSLGGDCVCMCGVYFVPVEEQHHPDGARAYFDE